MALVNKIFWGIAAAEALFFLIAVTLTLNQSGQNPDGGKEMGIVFGGILPFLILCVISLIYWRTRSSAVHIVLLIAVIVPAAMLAAQWLSGPLMDRDIAVGGYLYDDSRMKSFVAAVARLNETKVRQLAPGIDVDKPGANGVTPLRFAIEQVDRPGQTPEQTAARIEMIRVLLSLGAKADRALPTACRSPHSESMQVLLDAGANPNAKDEEGSPAFFACLSAPSGGLQSLHMLAAKGADFNALDGEGIGVLIRAATFSEWEAMLYFLEQGVKDTSKLNGKNAAAMINQAIVDDKQNGRETSPALARLVAKLNP